jgi:hypothetical protein
MQRRQCIVLQIPPCLFVIKYKDGIYTLNCCTHLVGNDGILVNDDIHELELVGAALEVQEDGGVTMHEAGLANDLHLVSNRVVNVITTPRNYA